MRPPAKSRKWFWKPTTPGTRVVGISIPVALSTKALSVIRLGTPKRSIKHQQELPGIMPISLVLPKTAIISSDIMQRRFQVGRHGQDRISGLIRTAILTPIPALIGIGVTI